MFVDDAGMVVMSAFNREGEQLRPLAQPEDWRSATLSRHYSCESCRRPRFISQIKNFLSLALHNSWGRLYRISLRR